MTCWQGKHGPYLIAEIGGNHEGDFNYAKELTALACESGVDAVKFQIYTGESLVSKVESPDRYSHFQKFQFTPDQYITLAELCKEKSITFTASVWDIEAFSWLDSYLPFYKIGSGDMTAFPILKKVASFGKPIILSTGLSTIDDVTESVEYLQSLDRRYESSDYLALLQCTSMYPIPYEDANLKVMDLFKSKFNLTVGYSDHTEGTLAVDIAVAMGAEIIEFHFTDSREGKIFRDHKVSFTKSEVVELIEKIKKILALQGNQNKQPMHSEIEEGHIESFRRSIYACKDLDIGSVLTEDDIVILRPGTGIDPRKINDVLGKKINKELRAFEKISMDILL